MGVRIVLIAAVLVSACKEVEIAPNKSDANAVESGKAVIQRLGCGACHEIPGIWPQGTTGPSLTDFRDRGVIAGRYPNRPKELTEFLLDPSGTAMPRQPMTPSEASDIAAYLHADDVE